MATPWQQFCWKNKAGRKKNTTPETHKNCEKKTKIQQRAAKNAQKGEARNNRNANRRAPSDTKHAPESPNKEQIRKEPGDPQRERQHNRKRKTRFSPAAPKNEVLGTKTAISVLSVYVFDASSVLLINLASLADYDDPSLKKMNEASWGMVQKKL